MKSSSHPKRNMFGALLRQHRLSAGLSQAALASRAGVSTSLIALLELGRRHPRRDKVLALAQALALDAKRRDSLLLRAGLNPLADQTAGPVWEGTALSEAIEQLLDDPRLTPRQKLIAESLLEAFAKWLRDELATGKLNLRVPGLKK